MDTTWGLIAFDLDGTLVATAPEIGDAVNDTLRRLGRAEVSLERVTGWIGHGTRELLLQALAHADSEEPEALRGSDTFARALQQFNRDYLARCGTRSQPYAGACELLATLRAQGVRTCVVTNKETRFTARVLAGHGIDSLLDRVVCGDTLPVKKPDPAGLHSCLQALGVPASRALFVGDSSIDAATARAAGLPVWLLSHGYNMGQPVSACAPDRVFDDFASLQAALKLAPAPITTL